jgi:hypothetical protein
VRKIGNTVSYYSDAQLNNEKTIVDLAKDFVNDSAIPDDQKLRNLSLFTKPQVLARIIYFLDLYKKIVDVPGVIMEFGVQYGASLTLLANLRNCIEYFNVSRRVIGFDTFAGFPTVSGHDKNNAVGDYAVRDADRDRIDSMMAFIDSLSPHPSLKKYELVQGAVSDTLPDWLKANPEAIVSMAHLDFDLFEPTEFVLGQLADRLTRGSLVVFDELNHPAFPGETIAVMKKLGLRNIALRRHPLQPFAAYFVVE